MRSASRSALLIFALVAIALAQTSVPVAQPQPNQPSYATSLLNLFVSYDRDSYRKAFGVAAPAFDPSKAPKSWFDTSRTGDPDEAVLYKVLGTNTAGQPALKSISMTVAEAAAVNLVGREPYAPYVAKDTPAYIPGAGGGQGNTPITAVYLTTLDQATQLAKELGGTVQDASNLDTVWGTETRRQYNIVVNGIPFAAGLLLQQRWAQGVGVPGVWTWPDFYHPTFTAVLPPDGTGRTDARPMPMRDLLPNEVLKDSPFGVAVYRTDIQAQQDAQSNVFTVADRLLLQKIAQKLGVQ